MIIDPIFDPILGKLRNSDKGLLSLASITDPFIVNNLGVLSNASIVGTLNTNSISNNSTVSTNLLSASRIISATATITTAHLSNIEWNLTSGSSLPVEGQMNWDTVNQTVVVGMAGGNVDVALGMETLFPKRVKNSTATTMAKGSVVYINGVSGNDPTVTFAIATGDQTSAYTLGMTSEVITAGQKGWVTTFGEISGLNLSAYTGGDTLYLSGATAGLFTNVKPQAPIHYVRVGTVVKATADGSLVVNVINGFETDELHDVSITSLASGQILQSGVSTLWYNRSFASAFNDLVPTLSLGSLAVQNQLSYGSIINTPSLGSLAVMNQLSYTSLTNQLSLSSLAVMQQLSFASLTNQPSLSSLAFQSTIDYTTGQITNKPALGSLAVMNQLSYLSLTSAPSLTGDYLRLDTSNQLSGATLTFDITNTDKNIFVSRVSTTATAGKSLTIQAGGAKSGGTNLAGGNLELKSGIATGNNTSDINFYTVTDGASGTADRSPTQKMTIKGNGYVGIGTTNPTYPLTVVGGITTTGEVYTSDILRSAGDTIVGGNLLVTSNVSTTGDIYATGTITGSNLSGTNTGDQVLPIYGDGADGLIFFDGYSNYTFATNDGLGTYTLTRDIFGTDIYIYYGITLITAGYRVFANSSLSVDGTLHNNGSNASGTTAGAGGLGGFFKAGGAGATGLLAASAGANGTAQATPTANTWVGGLGGRGGQGRATNTTFVGGMITSANVTVPADADGGNRVTSNIINFLTRYIVGATNWQMTPSIGGGAGAKSATGTTATSGAGGGGGGIVLVASPVISGFGNISANGGTGGNASGTGGNFGGGGGGGGGIVAYVARIFNMLSQPTAYGGAGGTSVIGTNGTLPVAVANGTATTATRTMTITPTVPLTKGNLYMVTFHLNITGGIGGSGINSMSGYGFTWTNLNTRVEFNSIASPVRVIETWYGYYTSGTPDLVDDNTITVNLSDLNTTARCIIDEITNTDADLFNNPVTANTATNVVNSALTLTVTLPSAPTTGNLVYSVFGRTVATGLAAGAGNTLVNNQSTAPILASQVSSAQQANAQTHTTTNGAIAGISVEITKSSAGKNGADGWDGKVIRIYG